jgi:hypothetical protein
MDILLAGGRVLGVRMAWVSCGGRRCALSDPEDNITGVDVDFDIGKTQLFKTGSQLRHTDNGFTTNIDTAKQGYV